MHRKNGRVRSPSGKPTPPTSLMGEYRKQAAPTPLSEVGEGELQLKKDSVKRTERRGSPVGGGTKKKITPRCVQ